MKSSSERLKTHLKMKEHEKQDVSVSQKPLATNRTHTWCSSYRSLYLYVHFLNWWRYPRGQSLVNHLLYFLNASTIFPETSSLFKGKKHNIFTSTFMNSHFLFHTVCKSTYNYYLHCLKQVFFISLVLFVTKQETSYKHLSAW